MSQTIKLKRGTTTPTTSNIVSGEVAIDTSAQKLYINDAGTIKEIGGGLGSISVSDVPNLPASKITSGTFAAARIPNISGAKITSGTVAAARIANLAASKITSGTFATARIPSLAASKITSGTFDAARIPSLAASKITSGTFDAARIPTLDQYVKTAGDTMSGRLVIEDSSGGDGSWTGGILIDNTATDAGEPAIAFQNSAMGSNYWIVGSNQDNELHFSYGTVFQDGNTKLNLKSDGKLGVGTGANALTHKFNVTGTSLLDGAVHVAEHLYHADDTNTYIRLENDQISIVAGGTTKFHSSNTYLTTSSTINADTVDNLHATSFLRSDANDTATGQITISNTADAQLKLTSPSSWTGIGFNDSAAAGYQYIWHNGEHGTFAIGGGGSNVSGKKLHVDGGMTVGANMDSTATNANGLTVEQDVTAKVFVDRDNSAYYVNPAGLQRQDQIYANWVGIGTSNNTSGSYKLNMGGSIDMNNNHVHYINEAHFNGGSRFKSDGGEGLILRSGSASVSKIRLGTNSDTARGYLYANSSNEIGLLDSDHQWAIRHSRDNYTEFRINNSVKAYLNNDQFYHTSSIRSPIFYDRNNTNYYFHGDSESRLANARVERYFQWAHGKPTNNLGDPTVTEMALFDEQFNNKTLEHATSKVTFWRQQTSSSSWTEYTAVSDSEKKQLLRGAATSSLSIPNLDYKFRIEVDADGYTFANALYMYWSSNSHNTQVHIYKRRCSDNAWIQHTSSSTTVSSWPGHLYLPFSNIPWHETNTTSTGHFNRIRIEFIPNWSGHADYGDRVINLYKMQIWGGYPAGRRTPYYYDENLQYFFPQNIQAYRYYDRDNTSKYVDPAGTSELSHLNVANNITASGNITGARAAFGGTALGSGEDVRLGGIRGRFSNELIHLYNRVNIGYPSGWAGQGAPNYGLSTHGGAQFNVGNVSGAPFTFNGHTIWHAGNDGSGSQLDADLLDGLQGSFYFKSYTNNNGGWSQSNRNFSVRTGGNAAGLHMEESDGTFAFQIYGDGGTYGFLDGEWANWDIKKTRNGTFHVDEGSGLKRVLNEANWSSYITIPTSLPANGGNADTVDGQHASAFAPAGGSLNTNFNVNKLTADSGANIVSTSANPFRWQRSGTGQTGQDDNVTVFVDDSNIYFTHNNDADGDASSFHFRYTAGGNAVTMTTINSDYLHHSSDIRAPIFYDTGNTGYYADPNGNSRLYRSHLDYIGVGAGANSSGSYRINMGGSIDMNANNIDYVSQLHFNDNVRFYDDGNDNYLNFKYGDGNYGGIVVYNGGGTRKGYLYADNSGFGLLDNDGHWALRTQTGTNPLELRCDNNVEFQVFNSYTLSPGSSRAPVFYDSNNSSYYANPASTSNFNALNVGGSPVWTSGNDGPGSGLNADLLDGLDLHTGRNNNANKVVRTDGNGYIQAGWINTTSGATTNTLDRIYASNDGYIRYVTPATLGSQLSSHINYNNIQNKPTIPDTSNLVTTNTAQTISGAKTFTANVGVSGNISANFYAFNGAYVNATADVRAPIYYDRNNTAFYIHADSESVLGNVRANDFRLSSGNGKGVRFWNSNSYKIYMSSTGDSSWGGRAPYESTSDYNMYFRMTGGTNRGFVFRSDTTNVAGIDSSGNFNTSGIVKTGNGAASAPAYSFTADYDSGMFSIGSNAVGFSTGGTQRFKINANGLLLTGTSSLYVNGQQTITNTRDIMNVVNYQNTDGHMQLHRTGAAPLIINRKGTTGSSGTSRGEILNFKSASTKIGRIGYAQPYGGLLYFATGNTSGYGVGVYHFSTSSDLRPVTHTGANNDNAMDLGATSARYDDVYATNGTIQTSDRNEKQDIQALTDAETRAATACKGLIRRFRWVDSVAAKGDDARYHFGAIAQDVEAAFIAEGLDAGDYGLFIRSTWWEHEGHSYPTAEAAPTGAVEKTRLGIRYNQLFAFIISTL